MVIFIFEVVFIVEFVFIFEVIFLFVMFCKVLSFLFVILEDKQTDRQTDLGIKALSWSLKNTAKQDMSNAMCASSMYKFLAPLKYTCKALH